MQENKEKYPSKIAQGLHQFLSPCLVCCGVVRCCSHLLWNRHQHNSTDLEHFKFFFFFSLSEKINSVYNWYQLWSMAVRDIAHLLSLSFSLFYSSRYRYNKCPKFKRCAYLCASPRPSGLSWMKWLLLFYFSNPSPLPHTKYFHPQLNWSAKRFSKNIRCGFPLISVTGRIRRMKSKDIHIQRAATVRVFGK